MYGKDDAVFAARCYARQLGLQVVFVKKVSTDAGLFGMPEWINVQLETDCGHALASCSTGLRELISFVLADPTNKRGLLPPWLAYPTYSPFSGGWRQGYGESYLYWWLDWYDAMDDASKAEYRKQYPEPRGDDRLWENYYSEMK